MSGLGEVEHRLVRLAASLTAGQDTQVVAMDGAAGVAPEAAEEVLLQSYLFQGFPVALNALGLWRRRTGRPAPKPLGEDPVAWAARGEDVCGQVYHGHYEELRALMRTVHPELDEWAVAEGYGKVLGRPGLDLRKRELCVAAQLAGLDVPRQLFSHLRGCLNVGATPADVEAMLKAVADIIGRERSEIATRIWERVLSRWRNRNGA